MSQFYMKVDGALKLIPPSRVWGDKCDKNIYHIDARGLVDGFPINYQGLQYNTVQDVVDELSELNDTVSKQYTENEQLKEELKNCKARHKALREAIASIDLRKEGSGNVG